MQKYLFVSSEEAFTRDEVMPDEFKLCAKGDLQIFELDPDGGTVSKYDPDSDAFEEIRRTFS